MTTGKLQVEEQLQMCRHDSCASSFEWQAAVLRGEHARAVAAKQRHLALAKCRSWSFEETETQGRMSAKDTGSVWC